MNIPDIEAIHATQPFFVVNDEAYARMLKTLQDGEPFVKTYLGYCPHYGAKKCRCPSYKNLLKDGKIVREVCPNDFKDVLSVSMIKAKMLQNGY